SPVLPPIIDVPKISRAIACAVGRQAVEDGVAPAFGDLDIDERVEAYWWEPIYPHVIAI
ncbi:MAG: NAD-dependent malic enzyme, partial [Actinobacteria bacterium]|nr:NAD-dependent malic enzyme [Actinomycetota bacterium]